MKSEGQEKSNDGPIPEVAEIEWEKIGPGTEENLDYIVDYLTDLEIFLIRLCIAQGPQSARKIWNQRCEVLYRENIRQDDEGHISRDEWNNNSNTELAEKARNALQEKNCDFESYHTVKKTLESLEDLGLLVRRDATSGNADYLWMINPGFKKRWRRRRKQVRKEFKEERDKADGRLSNYRDLYGDRLIKFYQLEETVWDNKPNVDHLNL